jgi:hypothetical protein
MEFHRFFNYHLLRGRNFSKGLAEGTATFLVTASGAPALDDFDAHKLSG